MTLITPDVVNGALEMIGGFAIWLNVFALRTDKGYAGIRWHQVVFFTCWGFWNLFYYPNLDQWFSFVGGLNIAVANLVWVFHMMYYGRKK